ncbi:hypothetical protein J437_LFUL018355 [Ladona fulva]|uniref:Uncharacterized protein n=1 Tax=Ladona fulva TaxID=123851 RepID=A0A8K0KRI8_LADFU|nr:hypothetical protein J437_LFUL018355 [Ladona fulva]
MEFARKPKTIREFRRWKATEFSVFLKFAQEIGNAKQMMMKKLMSSISSVKNGPVCGRKGGYPVPETFRNRGKLGSSLDWDDEKEQRIIWKKERNFNAIYHPHFHSID